MHEMHLENFSKRQAGEFGGDWYYEGYYSNPGGCKFQLAIHVEDRVDQGPCPSPIINLNSGDNDKDLEWPNQLYVHFVMLNQRGNHGHYSVSETLVFDKLIDEDEWDVEDEIETRRIGPQFLPDLGYDAEKNIQYLNNDSLHFQMYMHVNPM